MKTIKEVSQIAGISVAALRYYDEIGLLKPARLTDAGYRLYDNNSLETLQQILFFRELDIPLADIKSILEDPGYDKKQVLLKQKKLLENKRNRLNGIIELITDVVEGVNAMSFEAFNDEDLTKIWEHFTEQDYEKIMAKLPELGVSVENPEELKNQIWKGLKENEKDVLKWYGSKDKFMDLYSEKLPSNTDFIEELDQIYRQFAQARQKKDGQLAEATVQKLAAGYKNFFQLDNSRAMLLDLAAEYTQQERLAQENDKTYGEGSSEYIAQAIRRYYGVEVC